MLGEDIRKTLFYSLQQENKYSISFPHRISMIITKKDNTPFSTAEYLEVYSKTLAVAGNNRDYYAFNPCMDDFFCSLKNNGPKPKL